MLRLELKSIKNFIQKNVLVIRLTCKQKNCENDFSQPLINICDYSSTVSVKKFMAKVTLSV